jgi:hypothetical protein
MKPQDYHKNLVCNRANIFSKSSFLSKSVLWELENKTPKAWRFAPREFVASDAMAFGSAVDCKLLTPDLFGAEFTTSPFDSFRTKEAKEWKAEQIASGVTILTDERLKEVGKAIESIESHPIAGPMLDLANGKSQSIQTGKIKGVNFKSMLDFVESDMPYLTDLKTIRKVDRRTIEKHSFDFGYAIQAAIYRKLWNQNHPEDQRQGFRFVWVESCAPYEVAVTEMPESDIQYGEAAAVALLDRLIDCTQSNHWPGPFDDKVAEIGLPAWAEGIES